MDRLACVLGLGLVLQLIGCSKPEPAPSPPVVAAPRTQLDVAPSLVEAPAAVEAGASPIVSTATPPAPTDAITEVADAVDDAVIAAVDSLDIQPKAPRTGNLLSPLGFNALVAWETGGRSRYTRLYQRPIWPGGASGPTIGIGYDLGHQLNATVLKDWAAHPQKDLMLRGTGVTGQRAKAVTREMREIVVPYPIAEDVFRDASLIVYWRIAHRSFGEPFLTARPTTRDALTSLVYNRGGSMSGAKREEMRVMRDVCLPEYDYTCLAAQMRKMKRHWRGTTIEAGMNTRREGEAVLIETP